MINETIEELSNLLAISTDQARAMLNDELLPTPEQQKILAARFNVTEEVVKSLCGT